MKYLLILLTTFFLTHPLSAQMGMGKPKEIKALSERKMIVITETLSKKATDKLKKKGKTAELADIQQRYDAFNAMVKSVVAKRWTMHPEVEYKTWEQIKKMPNQKREQYAIMYFMTKRAASSSAGYIPAGYTMLTASMDEEETTKHNFSSLFQTFTIDKAEDVPVDKIKFNATPVYTITLPELYPSVLSVTFALASTNNYFEHRLSDQKYSRKTITKEIAANSARLKDKTLLIPDNWKDKELSLGQIKAIYPHPVRIVNATELEEIVNGGDPQYAWFVVLPAVNSSSRSNSVIFMHQIIDNGDGAPLGMYLPGMGSMMLKASIGGESGKDRMTEKTLKKMVEDFGKVSDDGQEEEEESKN